MPRQQPKTAHQESRTGPRLAAALAPLRQHQSLLAAFCPASACPYEAFVAQRHAAHMPSRISVARPRRIAPSSLLGTGKEAEKSQLSALIFLCVCARMHALPWTTPGRSSSTTHALKDAAPHVVRRRATNFDYEKCAPAGATPAARDCAVPCTRSVLYAEGESAAMAAMTSLRAVHGRRRLNIPRCHELVGEEVAHLLALRFNVPPVLRVDGREQRHAANHGEPVTTQALRKATWRERASAHCTRPIAHGSSRSAPSTWLGCWS